MFKINVHLFTAAGPEAVRRLADLGPGIFLDLKYHDIPNTVAGAIAAAACLPGIRLMDVHASGGQAMMRAGAKALAEAQLDASRPKLLGITILTSLDRAALREIGMTGTPAARVVSLARLAKRLGLDGVVASPQEIRQIRKACGRDFLIVVPGEAIKAGADYLVVGRPIAAAVDPRVAAAAIVEEMAAAMHSK